MKKVLTLLLCFCMLFTMAATVCATSVNSTMYDKEVEESIARIIETGAKSSNKATLTSDSGAVYKVETYETEERMVSNNRSTGALYEKEVVIVINNETMRAASYLEAIEWDSTDSVRAILSTYYFKDGNTVLVREAKIDWVCYGEGITAPSSHFAVFCKSTGVDNHQLIIEEYGKGFRTQVIKTGFTLYASCLSPLSMVGTAAKMQLSKGAKTWNFDCCIMIAGNGPDFIWD